MSGPIIEHLEQIAEELVMAGTSDLSALGRIHEAFTVLETLFETAGLALTAQGCRHAVALVNAIILQEREDPDAALQELGAAVDNIQAVVAAGLQESQLNLPAGWLEYTQETAQATETTPAEGSSAAYTFAADPELLGEFLAEAMEHLESADTMLLNLEVDAEDAEALNAIFRAFHTIKGGAGFLALDSVQALAHQAETLLDQARAGSIRMAGPSIDATFDAIDALKCLLAGVRNHMANGTPPPPDDSLSDLIVRLNWLAQGNGAQSALAAPDPGRKQRRLGEILAEKEVVSRDVLESALEAQKQGGRMLGEVLLSTGAAPARVVSQALREQQAGSTVTARESVKVDADRLDRLVDLIGELVIAEAMVSQSARVGLGAEHMAAQMNQLDKITRDLQEIATSLRMVPLRSTFQKMARLVRDVAKKSGKQVDFQFEGDQHELDKGVVDKIGDPLMHMLRNAVDHGLEASTEERVAAGKPEVGKVRLRAFYRGSNVHIEISDDGRGLDRQALLKKAVERGMIRENQQLSDSEIFNLVFAPGLSTAKKVTDVSGRGVGMDVVKRNIHALRGQIDITSEKGRGSVFTIRLPLTLAIIDGMVIRIAEERFIVPTLSVVTAMRPKEGALKTIQGRGELLMFQKRLLPVFRLGKLLGVEHAESDPEKGLLLVVDANEKQVALLCDELLGQQQTVIKPLGRALQGIPGLSGSAIMPDGRAGIILDVEGIVRSLEQPAPLGVEQLAAGQPEGVAV